MHILYTADHKYFPHMLTSIYSLMENNKDKKITVHIIEDKFTKQDNKRLEFLTDLYSNLRIKLYSINQLEKVLNLYHIPKWRGSNVTNARLFANEIISDTDKLLYLDSDTIVVDSLDELFSKKTTSAVSAVREFEIPNYLRGKLRTYYNSGVLLFDYNKWEDDDCFSDLYNASQKNIELVFPDQDLLNIALDGKITTLSIDYNVNPLIEKMKNHQIIARRFYQKLPHFYAYNEVKEALKHPHILHNLDYLHARAWQENKVHPFNEEYELYRSLWDENFQREENNDFLANFKFAPYIQMISRNFLPTKVHQKLKQKVNK